MNVHYKGICRQFSYIDWTKRYFLAKSNQHWIVDVSLFVVSVTAIFLYVRSCQIIDIIYKPNWWILFTYRNTLYLAMIYLISCNDIITDKMIAYTYGGITNENVNRCLVIVLRPSKTQGVQIRIASITSVAIRVCTVTLVRMHGNHAHIHTCARTHMHTNTHAKREIRCDSCCSHQPSWLTTGVVRPCTEDYWQPNVLSTVTTQLCRHMISTVMLTQVCV